MELMDEFPRRSGQVAAMTQQLPPKALRRGLEGHRTKRVAHLAQQHRQMHFKTPPINSDQLAPALDFGTSVLTVKPSSDSRGVNRSIRLGKGRQTTHAHATKPAEEPPHPN